ncbi:MAG: hypothetical protein HOP16_03420 [Acidobacteria bacterium]|nr:hypothetical protein [Acidobacteriota bacterium]
MAKLMSILLRFRSKTLATLMLVAAFALAGTDSDVRAQGFNPESCVTVALGSLVETELNAFCRGYQGSGCVGEEFAAACSEGARARERRQETGGQQGNQTAEEEMERNRRLVEQLPPVPPAANLLLGHWRYVPATAQGNPLGALLGLAANLACAAIAGDGRSFEFRSDALMHGARTMDSMRYYQGNSGVVFALGERYLRLLAFEFDGRDRMRNDTCGFERVGAVAAAAAPVPSPGPAAVPTAPTPGRSANPGCAVPTTQLGVATVASVQRDIEARGGGSPELQAGGLASARMSDLSGSYSDVGPNIMAVNYDFDAESPAGKMVAVTIVRHADSAAQFAPMLAERKARITESVGPLQQNSETEFQASGASCRLRLITNPATAFLYEIYQLP